MKRFFAIVALLTIGLSVQAVEQAPRPLQAPPIPSDCDCRPICDCKVPQYVSADAPEQAPEKGPFFPIIPSGTMMQVTTPIPAGTYVVGTSQITFTAPVLAGTYRIIHQYGALPPAPPQQQWRMVCDGQSCRMVPAAEGYQQDCQSCQQGYGAYQTSQTYADDGGGNGGGRQPVRKVLRFIFKGRGGRSGGCSSCGN